MTDGREENEWYTVPELAARWPWSTQTIRNWIDSGELPGARPRKGAHRRVRKADADAFAANGFKKVEKGTPTNE